MNATTLYTEHLYIQGTLPGIFCATKLKASIIPLI